MPARRLQGSIKPTPVRPTTAVPAHQGHPAQGLPVCARGTVTAVVEEVVDATVVAVGEVLVVAGAVVVVVLGSVVVVGAVVVVVLGSVVVVVGSVVVVVGDVETKVLVKVVAQITVLPPPLPASLHWLIVTGSAATFPVTLHSTRSEAPPPLPEPLHWVTVAFVVLPMGAHFTVGAVPPPVPEPMHWSTVTSVVGWPLGMVLSTVTVHFTLLPPPSTMPLHWLTDVTRRSERLTVVVHPEGGNTPAAARQAVAVIVELVAPAAVTVLTISRVQVTWYPAPVGYAGGSHCATLGALTLADALGTCATATTTNRATTAARPAANDHRSWERADRLHRYHHPLGWSRTLTGTL